MLHSFTIRYGSCNRGYLYIGEAEPLSPQDWVSQQSCFSTEGLGDFWEVLGLQSISETQRIWVLMSVKHSGGSSSSNRVDELGNNM